MIYNSADELTRGRRLRPHEQVHDRTFLNDEAVFDNGDPVANFFDDLHFMGDDDNGEAKALINVFQQSQNGMCGLRVQGGGGFVAQQNFGVVGQGAGDTDALFLSTG